MSGPLRLRVFSTLGVAALIYSMGCTAHDGGQPPRTVADLHQRAATAPRAVSKSSNRFYSPTAGVSFEKPESWTFATLAFMQDDREKLRLDDAELEKYLKEHANPPLAAVLKYPEPYPELNPSFQVAVRPLEGLEGKSARELLEIVLPTLLRMSADARVVAPIREVSVGGLPAARVGLEYTLRTTDGGIFPTRSDMVVIPRGRFMLFVGMAREPSDTVAEVETESILSSMAIEP